jgi:putative CocE/NonD family hydrolase
MPVVARLLLGLPLGRYRARFSTEWIPLSDGVRLATGLARPIGAPARLPAVLLRTAQPAHARSQLTARLAQLVAESGYAVVVQECRGRDASEGGFVPFSAEAADGAEAIDWVGAQPWFDGRLALVGFGYSGFTAFAAASRAPDRVAALVVGFAGRDPHAMLYRGGALQLASALRFAARHSDAAGVPDRRLDLLRGGGFRPVREADRVTLRRVDWYRDWLDHPRRDGFWRERTPPLPRPVPPALLVSSWYEPTLDALLADYAELREAAAGSGGAAPELVLGPWAAGGGAAARLRRGQRVLAVTLRETLAFLERHLRGQPGADTAPVRVLLAGESRWRLAPQWPQPGLREQRLHLRSRGRANSLVGDGRLEEEAPAAEEPPDHFRFDPDDPAPSCGGALPGALGGPSDQRRVEARDDVLCYATQPLERELVVAGPVRVTLHVASSAPDTDFTAKLVQVDPNGSSLHLCEGITRCRWRHGGDEPRWLEPGEPTRIDIELGACGFRLAAGQRIRLEISSSSVPRFDRNGNVCDEPARVGPGSSQPAEQTVFHDAARPSQLLLPVLPDADAG